MHFLFLFAVLFYPFFYFSSMIKLSEPLPGVATEEFKLALEISDSHGRNASFVSSKEEKALLNSVYREYKSLKKFLDYVTEPNIP